ncbi:Hypothetical Protein FCC1311_066072 [Hondaea fermentalgiana]|uniref:Uncharacterized protein n=1 Tax=Hondaea fermentalgiana TaxID=2315210 RepID=A0A2R5GKX5_9STRA|nr:Hypothetical Protein FCC1311_066072 [Hondaea fermentalgiana]|eukprot:GBG30388.1 Hypothetical Protein FCC1311_066072 [Hondaea fermentalgiana]
MDTGEQCMSERDAGAGEGEGASKVTQGHLTMRKLTRELWMTVFSFTTPYTTYILGQTCHDLAKIVATVKATEIWPGLRRHGVLNRKEEELSVAYITTSAQELLYGLNNGLATPSDFFAPRHRVGPIAAEYALRETCCVCFKECVAKKWSTENTSDFSWHPDGVQKCGLYGHHKCVNSNLPRDDWDQKLFSAGMRRLVPIDCRLDQRPGECMQMRAIDAQFFAGESLDLTEPDNNDGCVLSRKILRQCEFRVNVCTVGTEVSMIPGQHDVSTAAIIHCAAHWDQPREELSIHTDDFFTRSDDVNAQLYSLVMDGLRGDLARVIPVFAIRSCLLHCSTLMSSHMPNVLRHCSAWTKLHAFEHDGSLHNGSSVEIFTWAFFTRERLQVDVKFRKAHGSSRAEFKLRQLAEERYNLVDAVLKRLKKTQWHLCTATACEVLRFVLLACFRFPYSKQQITMAMKMLDRFMGPMPVLLSSGKAKLITGRAEVASLEGATRAAYDAEVLRPRWVAFRNAYGNVDCKFPPGTITSIETALSLAETAIEMPEHWASANEQRGARKKRKVKA